MIWVKVLLITLVLLAVVLVGISMTGASRWDARTRGLRERLEAGRQPIRPSVFSERELEGLPAPVQRYFHTALKDGQPMVAAVTVEHAGMFNMSETGESWKLFTSTQRVVTKRPGFVWDGNVAALPGLPVRVHDAYVDGEGILHPALFGLFSLMDLRGTGDVARGELLRFFAEAAWYPTVLLPSQGVQWEAVDDRSARATLTDGGLSLTLLFRFNEDGLIDSIRAESRGRTVGGKVVSQPWEGRWSDYEVRDGMTVPMRGEVAWMPPEGEKPYWRGRITGLEYEFAR